MLLPCAVSEWLALGVLLSLRRVLLTSYVVILAMQFAAARCDLAAVS